MATIFITTSPPFRGPFGAMRRLRLLNEVLAHLFCYLKYATVKQKDATKQCLA